MSREPFNRLVKLAARAFYDDITMKGDNQPKNGRSDNRGMAVVILDALSKRQWVREEDLAKNLKLHTKQLRRTLRFFEEEKLVARDSRKETAKGVKFYSAAVAATADNHHGGREGEEKVKLHTHSYCCLDYAQIYDVVRYRVHRMKKKLKDQLEDKDTNRQYMCPNCKRRYDALDAARLCSDDDFDFHCEFCKAVLEIESDNLTTAKEVGDGDDRKRRREHLKDQLQRIEVDLTMIMIIWSQDQLKPLVEQLTRVKDLALPEFGTLQAWEARANAAARAENGDAGSSDASKSTLGQGYGGTQMPFLGETKVEIELPGMESKEDSKVDPSKAAKVLPPWMIKQGMVLTKEQRGEVKQESKVSSSNSGMITEDKKVIGEVEDDEKTRQDAYLKAYYAAVIERQRAQEDIARNSQQNDASKNIVTNGGDQPSERKVGYKSKREDDDDGVEWEEDTPADNSEKLHIVDLNVEAEESDDGEDGIDWEDG